MVVVELKGLGWTPEMLNSVGRSDWISLTASGSRPLPDRLMVISPSTGSSEVITSDAAYSRTSRGEKQTVSSYSPSGWTTVPASKP